MAEVDRARNPLPVGRLAQVEDVAGVSTGSVIDWDQNVPGAYD